MAGTARPPMPTRPPMPSPGKPPGPPGRGAGGDSQQLSQEMAKMTMAPHPQPPSGPPRGPPGIGNYLFRYSISDIFKGTFCSLERFSRTHVGRS